MCLARASLLSDDRKMPVGSITLDPHKLRRKEGGLHPIVPVLTNEH